MSATRELIAALVAGGMDAADAAGLVARAAVEMTVVVNAKSAGAIRQQRYRERNKASPSVTLVTDQNVTQRNEASPNVTPETTPNASQTVTKRNEASHSNDAANPSLTYLLPIHDSGLSEKNGSKKERSSKKRNAPLPENWTVPHRAIQIAAELGLAIEPIEGRFRDYLAASGKLYADYDAGFCNFVRNTPNFNGGNRGQGISNYRTDPGPGRATSREALQLAAMGRGAANRLEEGAAARRGGDPSGDTGTAEVFDLRRRTENAG